MISASANINIASNNLEGLTPLYEASRKCNKANTYILLNNGAIIDQETKQNIDDNLQLTDLDIAIAQRDTEKVKQELKLKPITAQLLNIPIICNDIYMLNFLLKQNPNLDILQKTYRSIENKTDRASEIMKNIIKYRYITQQLNAKNKKQKTKLENKFDKYVLFQLSNGMQSNDLYLKKKCIETLFLTPEPDKFRELMIKHVHFKKN